MSVQKMTGPQIADDLEARIRSGDYPADAQLHYGDLAKLYGVSRDTIKRAVALVRDRGLAVYVPGRGVFALDPAGEDHPD